MNINRCFLIIAVFIFSCCTERTVISENLNLNGATFLAGTEMKISVDENITNVLSGTLAYEAYLNGVLLKKNEIVDFYNTGELESGILAEDTVLNGISFPRNTQISFYKSGELYSGTLEITTEYKGRIYKSKSYIQFFETGEVSIGTLDEFKAGIGMTQSDTGKTELTFDIYGNVLNYTQFYQ